MEVFFLFLLALTVGSLTTLYWIPEPDLGRGYFQLNALIILGLLGLAAAVYYLHPFEPFGDRSDLGTVGLLGGLAAAFVYYGAIWRESWRSYPRSPLSPTGNRCCSRVLPARRCCSAGHSTPCCWVTGI
jgi:hypothetical protein